MYNLLFFSWMVPLVVYLKMYRQTQRYQNFLLSSQRFIFLCFTLRTVIYFDLDCVKCIRFVIRIFFFNMCMSNFSNTICDKTSVSPLNYLGSLVNDWLIIFVQICFGDLCSVQLIYLSILSPKSHCELLQFHSCIKVQQCQFTTLFSLSIFCCCSGSFVSTYKLQKQFFNIHTTT